MFWLPMLSWMLLLPNGLLVLHWLNMLNDLIFTALCVSSLFTEPCDTTTDELRLVPSSTDSTCKYKGRLEVCTATGWMEVCDRDWDFMDAEVACRQLGFNDSSEAKWHFNHCVSLAIFSLQWHHQFRAFFHWNKEIPHPTFVQDLNQSWINVPLLRHWPVSVQLVWNAYLVRVSQLMEGAWEHRTYSLSV